MQRASAINCSSPSSEKVHNPVKRASENHFTAREFLSLKFTLRCGGKNKRLDESGCLVDERCLCSGVKLWTSVGGCLSWDSRFNLCSQDRFEKQMTICFYNKHRQGFFTLLMLGLDPNFDSIYKGSCFSSEMCCDSTLSDHPLPPKRLHIFFSRLIEHQVWGWQ